jgi:hypothetical protein
VETNEHWYGRVDHSMSYESLAGRLDPSVIVLDGRIGGG